MITDQQMIEHCIFREAHDAFFILHPETLRFLEVNPAGQRLSKLRRQQVLELRLSDLFDSGSAGDLTALIKACKTTSSRAAGEEFQLVTPAGSVPVEVTVSRLHTDPHPLAVLIVRNLSKQKQLETRLRESEKRYRDLVELAPESIAVFQEGRLVYANQATANLLGAESADQLRGLVIADLLHPDDRRVSDEHNARVLRPGQAVPWRPFPLRRLDGQTITVESRSGPSIYEGRPAIQIFTRDVTDRKRAEEERLHLEEKVREAQKLESLGVLAGGIAHDFNNILTSILGYSDLAMMETPIESPARELIAEVVNGARKAADLTKQLLAYSGKGKFVVEPLDLNEQLTDMAQLLQMSISKKCALERNLRPALPAIEGDAVQIRQVIMNLIINASEAIDERGGKVTLTTGVMHFSLQDLSAAQFGEALPEGRYVYLQVADTGVGMSEETRARIFDPFFSTKPSGRGLGLAAVLGIVRGHRGIIQVSSELGKGTSFTVAFPAIETPVPQAVAKRTSLDQAWRSSGTVLVVDDEEAVRGIARHMLEMMGFTVLTASDGREGLEIFCLHAEQIRLVLLDMTMPRLDGAETFREMRRIRGDVRTILSSGYNEQSAVSEFAGKGLAGFLQKPYRYEELLAVVRASLQT